MADTRYTGSFDGLDLSDLTGGTAPSGSNTPPAPPAQPAPQPAPSGDPFENNEDERRGRGWGKWVIGGLIFAAIVAVMILWVIPAVQTHLNTDSNPSSSQAPSGSQAPGQNDGQTGNDSNSGDTDPDEDGQSSAKLTVAEQAALLDPWFKGIPESNWETKTAAQLGVDVNTPLGYFVKNFAVVLSDGTVIARGTSETGDSIPTIISDYTVPTEWNGTAIVIAEDDYNAVLVAAKLPEDTNQSIAGAIWRFDVAEGTYVFQFRGHSNPPATE